MCIYVFTVEQTLTLTSLDGFLVVVVYVRPVQVYENVTFGGVEHLRIADEEGMFERTVTLCSASKLFSLTGE